MEQGFQSLLLTGKYGVGDGNFPSLTPSDHTYINTKMSFQTAIYEKSVLFPSLNYPYASSSSDDAFNGININQNAKTCQISNEYTKWRCVEKEEKLKRMKTEPSMEAFTFIPTNALFNQLPELRSMEQVNQNERRMKQKYSPVETTANQLMLESELSNFQLAANGFTPASLQPLRPLFPPPLRLSNSEKTRRRRRHTSGDKTRLLQKLLPVEKKMNIATIYEEAYNYIQFLKAQISVLESMPVSSSDFRSENPRYGNLYGGLGKLNRQQLLEILINSPAAQSILYSKGCCIYSLEQLMLFKDIAEKSFFFSDH